MNLVIFLSCFSLTYLAFLCCWWWLWFIVLFLTVVFPLVPSYVLSFILSFCIQLWWHLLRTALVMALIVFMSHSFLAYLILLTLVDHTVLTAVFCFRPSRVLPCLLTFCFVYLTPLTWRHPQWPQWLLVLDLSSSVQTWPHGSLLSILFHVPCSQGTDDNRDRDIHSPARFKSKKE